MIETYTTWYHHGERLEQASSSYVTRVETIESNVDPNEQVMNILNDIYPYASSNTNQEGGDDGRPTMDSEAFKNYEKLLKNAKQELYPGCENFSVLTEIVELMHGKIKFRLSNKCYDYFFVVIKRMLPKENCLPEDHKSAQKVLKGLGFGYEKIHACVNNCILFYKKNKQLDKCPVCNEPRFKMTSQNRKTKIPQKIMRYLPLKPRLQRLYMLMHTATDMRWHKEGRVNDDVMRHPADGEAWKEFDRIYPDFAADPRNMFTMRVAVMWTVNDFPAYAMVSGWMTKSYLACPICKENVTSSWHARKVCYLGHRRWLPWDNEWRQKDKAFHGIKETRLRPREWSGDEILDQLNRLEFGNFGKGVSNPRPTTHLNWTHKSMLFELPYWSKLKLRHNLDVMHIEKNVFDTLVGTILDIERKTKDTMEARLDLERMGIRSSLWMKNVGGTLKKGHPFFTVKLNGKKEFFNFISSVKFPDGYLSNISRCVNVKGCKFSNIKSHDCHVILQRLLPIGIRYLLPLDVVKPIVLLLRFFSQLIARCLRKSDVKQLQDDIMRHCLPDEALLARPVNCRWMYPIKRYIDVETAFNRPQRNNDGGVRKEKLSVFAQIARPFGDPVKGESFTKKDMEVAHWFILNNCDDALPYLEEHEQLMKQEHPSHLYAKKHRDLFASGFHAHMNKLKELNSPSYDEELYNLARGPLHVELFSSCHVNGIKFLGETRDDKLSTQNSGVHVPGAGDSEDIDFYGKLTSVVQLLYKDRCQVILFKCVWFDTNPHNRMSVKRDHGLLSVNTTRRWYDEDPYILATMAKQIFYLDDPKVGNGWKVVQKIDRRGLYDIPEVDHDDNDDNVADQQLSSSIEIGEETLRDTNIVQEPFDVPEVPEFKISIDLGDLPQYNAPEEENKDEDEWESGNDSSEDSESYYFPIGLYGFQHYLSMLGLIILIPLVIVPAMGGTYGPSFVYLAPTLAIINSPEFQGLNGNLTSFKIGLRRASADLALKY
ncbi:uncharacterized protein [Malus domestica]|uniref:uncharacterized protein n=1 Tax=Malus domestica TaxID=3750 RepID=UPI00397640E0